MDKWPNEFPLCSSALGPAGAVANKEKGGGGEERESNFSQVEETHIPSNEKRKKRELVTRDNDIVANCTGQGYTVASPWQKSELKDEKPRKNKAKNSTTIKDY